METPVSGTSIFTSDDQALVVFRLLSVLRVASCSFCSPSSTPEATTSPVKPRAARAEGALNASTTTEREVKAS